MLANRLHQHPYLTPNTYIYVYTRARPVLVIHPNRVYRFQQQEQYSRRCTSCCRTVQWRGEAQGGEINCGSFGETQVRAEAWPKTHVVLPRIPIPPTLLLIDGYRPLIDDGKPDIQAYNDELASLGSPFGSICPGSLLSVISIDIASKSLLSYRLMADPYRLDPWVHPSPSPNSGKTTIFLLGRKYPLSGPDARLFSISLQNTMSWYRNWNAMQCHVRAWKRWKRQREYSSSRSARLVSGEMLRISRC